MSPVCVSWRLISAIECDSSSAATAAVSTLAEASLNACTALSARCVVCVRRAEQRLPAVERMAVALSPTPRQQRFDLRPERGDGGVDDGAALLLVADRGALFLGAALLGDVFMRRNPAAVRQRLVLGEHDAAVAGLHVKCSACFAPRRMLVEDVLAVGVDVAGETARCPCGAGSARAACSPASRSPATDCTSRDSGCCSTTMRACASNMHRPCDMLSIAFDAAGGSALQPAAHRPRPAQDCEQGMPRRTVCPAAIDGSNGIGIRAGGIDVPRYCASAIAI